jgi:hypothetical protein
MARQQTYGVKLSIAQRQELTELVHSGVAPARKLMHARILLKADQRDEAWEDQAIAEALEVSSATVGRVRKRFDQAGLADALAHRPQPPRPEKKCLDGAGEAHLVTLACSTPPAGQDHWTMELLADQMVRLRYAGAVSRETVRRTLKKTRLSRG